MPLEDNHLARSTGMPKDMGAKGKAPAMSVALVIGPSTRRRKLKKALCGGKAYSVCEAAIVVPSDSRVSAPGDLARTDIAVGYHSGSHYSALQALEVFLSARRYRAQIRRIVLGSCRRGVGAKNSCGECLGAAVVSVGARLSENRLDHFHDGFYVSP